MEEMRELVRERYGEIARSKSSCCGPIASCCGAGQPAQKASMEIGYSVEEIRSIQESIDAYVGCIAGAIPKDDYLNALKAAGFTNVKIAEERSFKIMPFADDPFVKSIVDKLGLTREQLGDISETIVSIKVEGRKTP